MGNPFRGEGGFTNQLLAELAALRGEVARLTAQYDVANKVARHEATQRAEAEAALGDLRGQLEACEQHLKIKEAAIQQLGRTLHDACGERDTRLQPWRPIETAPIDRLVLMWTPKENLYLADTIDEMPEFALDDMRVSSRRHWTWATHWMPLPEPPCGLATLTPPPAPETEK